MFIGERVTESVGLFVSIKSGEGFVLYRGIRGVILCYLGGVFMCKVLWGDCFVRDVILVFVSVHAAKGRI